MNGLIIEDAKRVGINPLLVYYAESGAGKTYTALLTARGIAGPNGLIVLIDTENKRGSLYADLPIFGAYKTINLTEPYHPERFVEAISMVEASGAAVGILDSGSAEWESVGGVTDLAAEIESSKGKGLHCWRGPKLFHAKFVARLMRSSIPWIVCLRAKFKTRQVKHNNKTEIIKDDFPSPIQAEDFIFEATCHALILPDSHGIRLTKWSHPGLKACFPGDGKPVELKHGELLAKWCAAGGQPVAKDLKALKTEFWEKTKPIHKGDKAKLESYLHENGFLANGLTLDSLKDAEFINLIQLADKFV